MLSLLGRYAKACVPILVPLAHAAQLWVETGAVDRHALGLVAFGAIIAIGVALTPNSSRASA